MLDAVYDVDIKTWNIYSFSLLFYINVTHLMVSLKQVRQSNLKSSQNTLHTLLTTVFIM